MEKKNNPLYYDETIDIERRVANRNDSNLSNNKNLTQIPGMSSDTSDIPKPDADRNQDNNSQKGNRKRNSAKNEKRQASKNSEKEVKKVSQQVKKEVGKKIGTVAKRAVKIGAKKGVALLGKALVAIVGSIGLPAVILIGAITVIVVGIMIISSQVIGTGEGADELGGNAKVLHEYIQELSENSIDPNKPEQYPYRVPEALLASVVQLDSLTKEFEEYGRKDVLADHKKLLKIFADKLKPKFTYKKVQEYTETRTRTCDDKTGKCTPWSTSKQTTEREILTNVKAWNGDGVIKYETKLSDWTGSNTYQTRQFYYYESDSKFTYNFEMLDAILNEQGYKDTDKRMFEMFFEATSGTTMYYTNWLNGEDITGLVSDFYEDGYVGNVIPGAGVPAEFMPVYLAASKKYGVPWEYLAAIHKIETGFSTNVNVSMAGAVGHTQFMPCTWIGWSHPTCKGAGAGAISKNELISLTAIKKYGGYGQDGNGDGVADPWNIYDAIFTTAYYLKMNGINKNPQKAVYAYNHAQWYVDEVLETAKKFQKEAKYENDKGQLAIKNAEQWLKRPSQYVFGGGRTQSDISKGIFDCSSFVHWAFKQAGVDLGPVSSTSTETLNKKGKKISYSQAKPGDLVFFDTYKHDGHVGIYLGDGKFIGCQTSNGVSIADMSKGYWKQHFSGHVRRI